MDLVVAGGNKTFLRDCLRSREKDIVGRSLRDIFPAELAQSIITACKKLPDNGEPASVEIADLFSPALKTINAFQLTALKDGKNRQVGYLLSYSAEGSLSEERRQNQEDQQKYQTLFEHADEGMWLIRDDYFTNANAAAARMLGYESAEELSNLHPSELSPKHQPDGKPSFEKAGEMMELAKRNGRHRFEWAHKKKSGEVFPVDVTLVRVPIDGQDILLCTWRDITEQKKAQQSLREARDAAESMTRLKSEFLSNMSHEIRTPMTGILGMLSLIPEEELSERAQSFVEKARTSAQALLNLINDILDLSRLEAGRMAKSVTNVDVPDIVSQVVGLLENKAHEKGLKLYGKISCDFPSQVATDERHLRQILLNLAGNAIKFTCEGEIVISAEMVDADDGGQQLKCTVKDTGIGIPAEKIDSIFDRFQQIDSSASRSHDGTGLGLSICRELAELHGGAVSVESEYGKGSTFVVLLPIDSNAEHCPEAVKVSPEASVTDAASFKDVDISDIHVLVAEDNIVNQLVISKWLENLGISCEVQANGAEVLARLAAPKSKARPIDLILMDIQMPLMGGVEATKKIRASSDRDIASIPIIALTANAMTGQGDEYIAAGMNGYMTKPINFDALELEMKRLASRPHTVGVTAPKTSLSALD